MVTCTTDDATVSTVTSDGLVEAAGEGQTRIHALAAGGSLNETVDVDDSRRLARASAGSRLHLVDGAGHTFGAAHPFAGAGPLLEGLMAATRRHFRAHLTPD